MASWISASWYADRKTDVLLAHDTDRLEGNSLALFQAFEERLNYLASIPVLIGKIPSISQAAVRYADRKIQPSSANKSDWETRPDLASLNKQLGTLATELKLDIIFVLNAEGYCIASSNSHTPESFVGTRYSDRNYYKGAIEGGMVHQYAVGRKTNVPGLFYASPILQENVPVGVIVIKSDIANFQNLLAPYHAFLTDNHDVIILASQPKFLQHRLDNARFLALTPDEQLQQYKRTEFPTLGISRWHDNSDLPSLRLFDLPDPVLVTERQIPGGDLIMHLYESMPELAIIHREKLVFAIIASLAGLSILSVLYQLTQYLSHLRQSKSAAESESERLHETLTEHEQQLETILNHLPVMVVARDPATHKVVSSNEAAPIRTGTSRLVTHRQNLYRHPAHRVITIFVI